MRRKEKNTLIAIIIAIISVSIIISGIFTNCVMNLDFSGKCISEQTSKGFQEGINQFMTIRTERITNKLNNLQEDINKGLLLTGGVTNK